VPPTFWVAEYTPVKRREKRRERSNMVLFYESEVYD